MLFSKQQLLNGWSTSITNVKNVKMTEYQIITFHQV